MHMVESGLQANRSYREPRTYMGEPACGSPLPQLNRVSLSVGFTHG
ncbi:MAG: hypothetical protein IJQ39_07670 [Thermoguttaceae bacterium]|nr:hypothetical protein [Thermoguttaceae bacterium]